MLGAFVSKSITVSIDAMGGDNAPDMVIEGLELARLQRPDAHYRVLGDEAVLAPLLARFPSLVPMTTLIHSASVVEADDKPSHALRHGRKTSMGLAIQDVKSGEAGAAVSAGNTGALMALSKFILRMLPGIDRPALISLVPTLQGECVILDLGANIECSSDNLVQFAIMGAAYCRVVLGLDKPRVALLNVGSEDLKGNDRVKDAAEALRTMTGLPLAFEGYIEGDAIGRGEADVIVTDGFTGNIALKTMEGTAKFLVELLKRAFETSTISKLGYVLSRSSLQSLRDHMNPNNHNGGMLLGLNGCVVKSHGGADAAGYASAVVTAIDLVAHNMLSQIGDDIARVENAKNTAE